MKKIIKEPLFHFLLLGLLLYTITAFVKHKIDPSNKIVVDDATVGRLVTKYILQTGSAPSKAQLDALINIEIKEEIQYREALRMGLDKDDEIIRRRLSQKIEFLKSDLAVVTEPSVNDLKKFYNQHTDLFMDSATVSFTHIYFNSEKLNSEQVSEKATRIMATLHEKKLSRAPELGDRFPLQYDYNDIDRLEASQLFGNSQMTDTLFKVREHQWLGPVRSGYGWHLIYVQKRKSGSIQAFDEIENDVKESYISFIKQQQNNKEWEYMKAKYTIDRKYLIEAK